MEMFRRSGDDCGGECCVCAYGIHGCSCLQGPGDDFYVPASKEEVIENLNAGWYQNDREHMIGYLRKEYGFDYYGGR